jgi:SAM-dependent methyltransferase
LSLSFAQLYHLHHSRHPEDLPFWTRLALETGGPVLELGCGTGRVLLPLSRAGLTVFGMDRDPDMLDVLKSAAGTNSGAYFWQGDFTAFCLAQRFPLIILPCNTYSTLDDCQRMAVLAAIRRHLAPEDIFALSMPNPTLLRRLPARSAPEVEETLVHPEDGEPVQVSSSWERSARFFSLHWYYDHLLPDGRVERLEGIARHHLVSRENLVQEFGEANLNLAGEFGNYRRSPYSRVSDLWIPLLQAR